MDKIYDYCIYIGVTSEGRKTLKRIDTPLQSILAISMVVLMLVSSASVSFAAQTTDRDGTLGGQKIDLSSK